MTADAEAKRRRGPGIDWPATFAGAGAAVTVAVLLSTLGAAGTLIGAALGSVIATVSSALYKQGIESSRRRVAEVQAAALQRDAARGRRHVQAQEAEQVGDDEAADPVEAPGNRWAALPWRRLALIAVAVFLIALLVISAIELIAGRSVSTITGGTDGKDRTSIGGVLGGGSDSDGKKRRPSPTRTPAPPSTSPTAPSSTAATTAPPSSQAPTDSGTPTPTVTVTVTQPPAETPTEPLSPTETTTP